MSIKGKKTIMREILEWVIYIVGAVVLVFLLNTEIYATTEVRQSSMQNTFIEGERLFVEKISTHFGLPDRGEVIIFIKGETYDNFFDRLGKTAEDLKLKFQKRDRENRLIKRVIAVPGDKVDIDKGYLYINDSLVEEAYIKGMTFKDELSMPVTVPEGKVFVMGDNRESSVDSRRFGLVDYKSIEGKVVFRMWPLKKIGLISKQSPKPSTLSR